MPTANRRRFVPQAIGSFLRQSYPHKELVIVDDGDDSIADLVPAHPQIRYERLAGKHSLGKKRNLCVEACRSDVIMHWDDDDWFAAWRIRYQVEALLATRAEVCGLREMLFYDPATDSAWLYAYGGQRPWLAGGSLLYTRDFWRRAPFPDVQVASDTRFIWNHRLDRSVAVPDYRFYVARIHASNTSPKQQRGPYWARWAGDIHALVGSDRDDSAGGRPSGPK